MTFSGVYAEAGVQVGLGRGRSLCRNRAAAFPKKVTVLQLVRAFQCPSCASQSGLGVKPRQAVGWVVRNPVESVTWEAISG